jgi:hypothetical protein
MTRAAMALTIASGHLESNDPGLSGSVSSTMAAPNTSSSVSTARCIAAVRQPGEHEVEARAVKYGCLGELRVRPEEDCAPNTRWKATI